MTSMLPGLTVEVVAPTAPPTPLRTDVAGFIGATRKGPVGVPVRTDGRTEYARRFGGFDPASDTAYAVHGYFENDGQVAWIVRVSGPAGVAQARWEPGLADLPAQAYLVQATSPGPWASGTSVRIEYRSRGLDGGPEFDVRVTTVDENVEVLTGLPPASLADGLRESSLVRLVPDPDTAEPDRVASAGAAPPARRSMLWTLTLGAATETAPDVNAYLAAIQALAEEPEVAIVAAPDLHRHLDGPNRDDAVTALVQTAAATLDRLVVLDVPPQEVDADRAATWVRAVMARDPAAARAAAAYHPPLLVPDPLGTVANPLRQVPASGHVAGVISRLDRQRGPHHTPANVVLRDAIDLPVVFGESEEVLLYRSGINLLRCARGRGLQVWGGRTLGAGGTEFVAHRRLLYQLVRAARAVATPLVFDINGPELRLTLVRGVTSVLLEAFRAGAMKGSRPEEAFRVRCDETNNPPEQDPGLLICEIEVAPAVPMEFIRLRLMLGADGRLEVIEA